MTDQSDSLAVMQQRLSDTRKTTEYQPKVKSAPRKLKHSVTPLDVARASTRKPKGSSCSESARPSLSARQKPSRPASAWNKSPVAHPGTVYPKGMANGIPADALRYTSDVKKR